MVYLFTYFVDTLQSEVGIDNGKKGAGKSERQPRQPQSINNMQQPTLDNHAGTNNNKRHPRSDNHQPILDNRHLTIMQGPTTKRDTRQSSAHTRQPTPDIHAGADNNNRHPTNISRHSTTDTRQTPKTTNTDIKSEN